MTPSDPPATPRRARRPSRTRGAIVDMAIRLFNERGISAVTTNHIAAELGISPGNLYYHFRNKEEIVRAAYEMYGREADALLEPEAARTGDPAALLPAYIAGTVRLMQRWPFFFEDMAELCRRDAALAQDLRRMQRGWVDHCCRVLGRLRAAGLIAAEVEEEELRLLAVNVWMVACSILGYARNEVDHPLATGAAARRGVRHIFALVRPHLTPAARAVLDASVAGQGG